MLVRPAAPRLGDEKLVLSAQTTIQIVTAVLTSNIMQAVCFLLDATAPKIYTSKLLALCTNKLSGVRIWTFSTEACHCIQS
jgi:hypothetical protein